MAHKYGGRKPMTITDNPDLPIHPLNCVPDNRPKGSWTNGIKAYHKDGSVAGWFYPPRIRNQGHKTRYGRKPHQMVTEEE